MNRLRNLLILVRVQLWLVPAMISVLALLLAYVLLTRGAALVSPGSGFWWLYSGDADSARDVLSSLLSGLITMTSLVVSITFVILTLAANQLGPRVISIFMADRQIQSVLGLFLGTILYVLVVLRTLDDSLGKEAVPHIAVTVGSALTIVCLFALLFYLHKVARSIIADTVVEAVADELHRDIQSILFERGPRDHDSAARDAPPEPPPDAAPLRLGSRGYVQTIDYHALVATAHRSAAVFHVRLRAGDFALQHGDHVLVHPASALDGRCAEAIRKAFVVGRSRTPAQDLEYGIRQLVEIAIRALSQSSNDPFTAIAVVNQLGVALEDVRSRALQPAVFHDESGDVRVVAARLEFDGMVHAAFDRIRLVARADPPVLVRMAEILQALAPSLDDDDAREAALAQLDRLAETVRDSPMASIDQRVVMQHIARARAAISDARQRTSPCATLAREPMEQQHDAEAR